MDGNQAVHAMSIDDLYTVERVLAESRYGRTELVMLDDADPFVRKRIPLAYACHAVWALLFSARSARLPKIEAAYEMPDELVVVYDYIAGQTIEEKVETQGPLLLADVLSIGEAICESLDALHSLGIIHRDITPANIVLAADGPHLIDFGIARLRGEMAPGEKERLGTYGFAAPEQYGFASADERSDIYSLGRLLGYMLCGVNPADKEQYEQALQDEGMVSRQMREVLERACAFEPSARFQDAASMHEALTHLDREDVPVRPEHAEKPHLQLNGTKPAGVWQAWAKPVLAIAAACTVVVCVLIALQTSRAESAAGQAGSAQELASSSSASLEASHSNPAASTDDGGEASSLAVSDIQWYCGQGAVQIAFRLHNEAARTQSLPGCRVEAYAADGSVLGTQDFYFERLAAGEDEVCTVTLIGVGTPNRVEVVPLPINPYLLTDDTTAAFSADGIAVRAGSYSQTVTGTLRKDRAGSEDDGGQIEIVVLQHDDAGNLVGVQESFVGDTMDAGETQPFSIELPPCEDAASTEVFAY